MPLIGWVGREKNVLPTSHTGSVARSESFRALKLTFLGMPPNQKMSQKVEKVHNFLAPPTLPQDVLDFFEFEI